MAMCSYFRPRHVGELCYDIRTWDIKIEVPELYTFVLLVTTRDMFDRVARIPNRRQIIRRIRIE